jgi:hypothetical protein
MLYTVVMDYRGGTYVSQVAARSVAGALKIWAAALDTAAIAGLGPQRKAEMIDDIRVAHSLGLEAALLHGLVNAWCATALTSGGLALINIIATKTHSPSPARSSRKAE